MGESSKKPVRILTDDVENEPILDFSRYAGTITNIIMGTQPKLSFGIYGEWGVGKTTLMKSVEKRLREGNDNDMPVLTVWFNAWRYEREDQFALIALLKSIAYAMADHQHYKKLGNIIRNGIWQISKGLLEAMAYKTMSGNTISELKKNISPKIRFLNSVEKDTIYFDGIKNIEAAMKKIRQGDDKSRVVVFIDDLDRCSPAKALEIFESVKVFLDLEGFIYVIGLSHETISKVISASYKESGIEGDKYIRKIIQVPITLPEWNYEDINDLTEKLSKSLGEPYSSLVKEKDLIASIVEPNPRETKRFINNFILAHEIFANSDIEPKELMIVQAKELMIVQALKMRWSDFYGSFSTDEPFRNRINELAGSDVTSTLKEIREKKEAERGYHENMLLKMSDDLWPFLERHKGVILGIKNWNAYRRAAEVTRDIGTEKTVTNEQLIELLRGRRIADFNKLREKIERPDLTGASLTEAHLPEADLSRAYLTGANLSRANLTGADLSRANLSRANLTGADLSRANLTGANLSRAYLTEAYLTGTDLIEAHLPGANLSRAYLTGANLSRAYLTGAYLTGAYLTGAYLTGAYLTGTDLSRANLTEANLTEANLTGADLSGANLTDAIIIGTRTDNVRVDEGTITSGIILAPGDSNKEIEKALSSLDPTLRDKVLRDNPKLKEIYRE